MMNQNHIPISFLIIIVGLIISIQIPTSLSEDQQYTNCGDTFECGSLHDVGYPFWGENRPSYCGYPGFNLNCQDDVPFIVFGPIGYKVLATNNITNTLTVARNDLLMSNTCPTLAYNDTFNLNILKYSSNDHNLSLSYGCTSLPGLPSPYTFGCTINGTTSSSYFALGAAPGFNSSLVTCNSTIVVRFNQAQVLGSVAAVRSAISTGFDLQWEANNTVCERCSQSGGRCGYDIGSSSFVCYCPDRPYDFTCNGTSSSSQKGGKKSSSTSINIILPIVGAVLAGVGIGWVIFYCRQRRKRLAVQSDHFSSTDKKELPTTPLANKDSLAPPSVAFTKSIPSYPSTKFDSRTETSYFGARIFTYTEIEEATEDFAEARELGDGGFGAVYYGVLSDGSVVAVKRLYENNYKRVEQFKNEVEILTRLRHPNLVVLYGCSSKRSKDLLLVYEYVPNGTVADHLHGNRASSGLLSWPVRLNIAVETAEALAYLHASDIIHRDVKTNNILLDNDFHVKVADFGLSRLFPIDATHVSTAPQGTPGYVDPEYYQMYQLTEKSDVYSFGVVLVELISSLPAVDTNRSRHDINLANMAINKIQNHAVHELVDQSLQFDSNSSVKRMVTSVAELAFQCLQQEKDMRPSMQEVLDTLRGIQSGGLNAQKVEVVDILADNGGSCKDATLPPSPGSVTDKSTGTSAKSSSV